MTIAKNFDNASTGNHTYTVPDLTKPLELVNDCEVWNQCPTDWLWIYDKLIVARKQHVQAGPAGVGVPRADWYIVRPITNIRMMARGAQKMYLSPGHDAQVPDGHFWAQWLTGPHISVDYHWGQQALTVEGFRSGQRLDRFSLWRKVDAYRPFPAWLWGLETLAEWVNVEYIGDIAIEVHLRYNDDFRNHDADEIIPVWQGQNLEQPPGYSWYASVAGERLGFWTRDK